MVSFYVIMILELFHIILMGTILFYKAKKFLKEKNILDFAFLWVLVLTTALVGYNAYLNVNFALGNSRHVYIGQMELSSAIGVLCSAPYFWFLLNLVGAKRIYTLPFVAALYIVVYGYFRPTALLLPIYICATFIPGSIALIVSAIKRKHGLSFSIGLSVVMFLFTDTFVSPNVIVLYYALEYSLMIVLILGVTGWWDRKVFYDREYANKIKNTWIAHRIGS